MLWKELFIERVASLGRFGRWLGALLTLVIGGGSLVLAGMMVYSAFFAPGISWQRPGLLTFSSFCSVDSRGRCWAGCSSGASVCGRRSRSPRSASAAPGTPF